jgi:hypothetical protein
MSFSRHEAARQMQVKHGLRQMQSFYSEEMEGRKHGNREDSVKSSNQNEASGAVMLNEVKHL